MSELGCPTIVQQIWTSLTLLSLFMCGNNCNTMNAFNDRLHLFTVPSSVAFWNSYKHYYLQMWSDQLLLFTSMVIHPVTQQSYGVINSTIEKPTLCFFICPVWTSREQKRSSKFSYDLEPEMKDEYIPDLQYIYQTVRKRAAPAGRCCSDCDFLWTGSCFLN